MISQGELKQLFSYDRDVGIFLEKKGGIGRAKIGSEVGCVVTISGKRYIKISIFGKVYSAHRLAWLYVYGSFPENEIDHIDGNGLNNCISNLRDVDRAENSRNQRLNSRNKTGVCGVFYNNKRGVFEVSIGIDGKLKFLGRFKTLEEAKTARVNAEKKYKFHKNHGSKRNL